MAALLLFLLSSRFSLDHPGTRPLSAGPSLGPEHPGTRLATPRCRVWSLLVWIWSQLNIMIKDGSSLYYPRSSFSMQYTSLQSKPYSNSRYFSSAGPLYHRTIAIHWTIGPSDHWRIILTELCCRPSSRNGKYTNGVAGGGGGYPGIQNMAYSPAYSNGVSYLQHSGIAFTFLGDKHFHKFTCVKHLHF